MDEYFYAGVNAELVAEHHQARSCKALSRYKLIIKEKNHNHLYHKLTISPFFDVINELRNGEVPTLKDEKVYNIQIEYSLFMNHDGIQLQFETVDKEKTLHVDILPESKEFVVTLKQWSQSNKDYVKVDKLSKSDDEAIRDVLKRIYLSTNSQCSFMVFPTKIESK